MTNRILIAEYNDYESFVYGVFTSVREAVKTLDLVVGKKKRYRGIHPNEVFVGEFRYWHIAGQPNNPVRLKWYQLNERAQD